MSVARSVPFVSIFIEYGPHTSTNAVCGCQKTSAAFGEDWKRKVAQDAGAHYRVPSDDKSLAAGAADACLACHEKPTRDKLTIRGVAP